MWGRPCAALQGVEDGDKRKPLDLARLLSEVPVGIDVELADLVDVSVERRRGKYGRVRSRDGRPELSLAFGSPCQLALP
jgi:hypothetical protein